MGICPFDRRVHSINQGDHRSTRWLARIPRACWGQEATRCSTLVQSVRVLDEQIRRPSEPAFRLLEPVQGSMKDKVVLNPPGSARYGRPLRQSAVWSTGRSAGLNSPIKE